MGLNRIDYPANLTTQADFSQHSELIETRFLDQVTPPLQVVAGVIPQGVVLQIGGAVYRSDSDTTITGTPSDYVRVTPDGATATAAYVSTLAGVSWAKQYAGYYDGSDNLYLFDEGKALAAGDIASVFGRYLAQQENGDVRVGRDLSVGNDLTVTDGATVGGTLNAGNVTFNNLTINGGMLPESSPYLGSVSVGPESYHTPSRGLYNSSWRESNRGSIFGEFGGDGPYSGNSSTRVYNTDENNSRTWYYARF